MMDFDNTSKLCGAGTGLATGAIGMLAAFDSSTIIQMLIVAMSGLFGIASSVAVAIVNHYLKKRERDDGKGSSDKTNRG